MSSTSTNYITEQKQKVKTFDKQQSGSSSMITPNNIAPTSTPKDNLNYTTFPGKHKSNLQPDRFSTTNLFNNKNNYVQYPSKDTNNESDQDYSRAPKNNRKTKKTTL